MIVQRPDDERREFLKVNGIKVGNGTIIKSLTGGGGGYGPAIERDPEAVRQDVIDGYVSIEHARDAYGVVITDSFDIDAAGTDKRREAMRASA